MPVLYPFSAVLGCDVAAGDLDPMGLALVLTSISPDIGGVLVRGEKGTAKSTTVRGLAEVLPPVEVFEGDRFSIDPHDGAAVSPDGPFAADVPIVTRPVRLVELPVGAADDRVVGALDLAAALGHGKVAFEPGLLARAHRGLLYVDEVNLLGDHLVDLLLDAAATGRVSVERDAVSLTHAARFVLIGTMNPEEGELRPQLLDRFGLSVEVAAPREPSSRVEVVRRRLAFDASPHGFVEQWAASQQQIRDRIVAAQQLLTGVHLSDPALLKVAEVCAGFEVDGLRADIVLARTARAHTAWRGGRYVTKADIRAAALLALPHRRRRQPFDAPGLDEDLLDQILGDDELPEPPQPEGSSDETESPEQPAAEGPDPQQADSERPEEGPDTAGPDTAGPDTAGPDTAGPDTAGSVEEGAEREASSPESPSRHDPGGLGGAERRTAAGEPYRPRLFTVAGMGTGSSGKRSKAIATRGARIGWTPQVRGTDLHVVATIRSAAERRAVGAPPVAPGRPRIEVADLRGSVRLGREANLLLFCVDASGSMAARKRMAAVKTAVLSLLTDAYRRRDKVGLVSFRGRDAELSLPPTGSIDIAVQLLADLPAGGRTPLAEALTTAHRVLVRERRRHPDLRPLLLLVTDGRATAGTSPQLRARQAAEHLARLKVRTVVIDTETGPMRLGLARDLATRLGAEHLPVAALDATALIDTVKGRIAG